MILSKEISRRGFLKFSSIIASNGIIDNTPLKVFAKEEQAEKEKHLNSEFQMYHEMSPSQFKGNILSLRNQGYHPVSAETIINHFNNNSNIPDWLSTFHITCDDGLLSQYEAIKQVYEKEELFVPITCFIMPVFPSVPLIRNGEITPVKEIPDNTPCYDDSYINENGIWVKPHRYMTKGQIIDLLEKGVNFGFHAWGHQSITNLNTGAKNMDFEIGEKRIDELYELAGRKRPFKVYAYPNGAYNNEIISFLQEQNYDLAFSIEQTTQHSTSTKYHLGRIRKS